MTRFAALALVVLITCSLDRWDDYLAETYGPPSYTTPEGLDVRTNGYPVDADALEAFSSARLEEWRVAMVAEGLDCDPRARLRGHLLISWRPLPFTDPRYHAPLAGLTAVEGPGWALQVGYQPELAKTALAFELAHAALWSCGLDPSDRAVELWHQITGVTI